MYKKIKGLLTGATCTLLISSAVVLQGCGSEVDSVEISKDKSNTKNEKSLEDMSDEEVDTYLEPQSAGYTISSDTTINNDKYTEIEPFKIKDFDFQIKPYEDSNESLGLLKQKINDLIVVRANLINNDEYDSMIKEVENLYNDFVKKLELFNLDKEHSRRNFFSDVSYVIGYYDESYDSLAYTDYALMYSFKTEENEKMLQQLQDIADGITDYYGK